MTHRLAPGVLAASALVVIAAATPVLAQAPARIAQVEVALWPEYDRPEVLVIYRVELAPSTPLPATLEISIPVGAGEPNAVAQMSGGSLVTIPYERAVEGAVARIRIETTQRQVQIEYYDPGLARDGTRREFTFRWPAEYAVEQLNVAIQEPPDSSAFVINPPVTETTRGAEGLLYDWIRFGPVAAGQATNVSFGYDAAGDQLTVESLQPTSSGRAAATATPGSGGDGASLPWLVIVGVGLLLVGVVAGTIELTRRMGRRTGSPEGGAFCTRCGAPVLSTNRFCGRCGHRLEAR